MPSESSSFFTAPAREQALEDLSGIGSWTYSPANHEFSFSPRSAYLLGLNPGQNTIPVQSVYRLLARESRKALSRLFRSQVPVGEELSFRPSRPGAGRTDGAYLEAKWSNPPELQKEGLVVGVLRQHSNNPELQVTRTALRERIKEQDCIYAIATLGGNHASTHSLLQAAAKILPQGWQFPEICGALIKFNNRTFSSGGFVDSDWTQTANRILSDGKPLTIRISYSKDPGTTPVFLQEEHRLLESLANLIATEIDRRAARDFSALLLDSSPDIICTLDREGNFRAVNFAAFRLWGYSPHELTGRALSSLVHPGDQHRTSLFRLAIINGQKFSDFENQIVHRDGSLVPCIWSAYWNQENLMMHCVVRDGADRKKARQEQQAAEQRLNALLRDGSDLIGILDKAGNYIYVAPTSTTILGLSPEDFLGKSAFRYIHPDDRQRIENEFHSLHPGERKSLSPFRYTQKDGSIRWFQTVLVNMFGNPAVGGIVANARDVTETMESEEELRRSHERADLLNLTTGNCIWDWNRITDEMYLGAGFGLHLQLEPSIASENRRLFLSRIHPDDRDGYMQSLNEAIQRGDHSWRREYRFAAGRGYIYVRDLAILLQNREQTVDRILGSVQNIQDQYLTEALDYFEKEMMEHSLLEGVSLSAVLARYLLNLESLFPETALAVVRLEHKNARLLAAPSVPALGDGTESTPGAGTELLPCWSIMVPGIRGTAVAALTGYQRNPGPLADRETYFLRASRLLSVVIAKFDSIAALQRSNEIYESITRAVGEGLFEIDLATDRMELSGNWNSLSGGLPQGPWMAADWEAVVLPQDRPALQSHRKLLISQPTDSQKRSRAELDYRIIKTDGAVAFVRETALLVRDSEGRPERIVGSVRSIDRLKIEELTSKLLSDVARVFSTNTGFQKSIKRLLELLSDFALFSVGEMWIFRPERQKNELVVAAHRDEAGKDFRMRSASIRTFEANQGLPGQALASHSTIVWDNLNKNDAFIRKEQSNAAGLRSGVGIPLQVRGLQAALVFLGRGSGFRDGHLLKTMEAIADYIAQEIARKLQEEQMNFLFEGAPDVLAIAGPDGRFTRVNPAFCKLMNRDSGELTTRPFTEFMHPDDREATLSEYRETIDGRRKAQGFVNRYRTASGDYRWMSWSSSDVFGYEGQVFAYGRDITDRIQYTRRIERQNSQLRQIAWIQSHLVRAPLARILGLVELLDDDSSAEEHHGFLEALKTSANELDRVIREIVEEAQRIEEPDIERFDCG